jgi:hypothetical protein
VSQGCLVVVFVGQVYQPFNFIVKKNLRLENGRSTAILYYLYFKVTKKTINAKTSETAFATITGISSIMIP